MGKRLASALSLPFVEFDAIYWGPGWAEPTKVQFRSRIQKAIEGEAWVADGNYSVVRDIVWTRADTLVWLDFRLSVIMPRLLMRTLRRTIRRTEIWPGCRERFWDQFASRDSLFLWALKTYWRRRKQYPALLLQPEFAHLHVIRLRSPGVAERWVRGLER